jgi:hypothetical protein
MEEERQLQYGSSTEGNIRTAPCLLIFYLALCTEENVPVCTVRTKRLCFIFLAIASPLF